MTTEYAALIDHFGPFATLAMAAAIGTLIAFIVLRIFGTIIFLVSCVVLLASAAAYFAGIFIRPTVGGIDSGLVSTIALIPAALSGALVCFHLMGRFISHTLWHIAAHFAVTAGLIYGLVSGWLKTFGG